MHTGEKHKKALPWESRLQLGYPTEVKLDQVKASLGQN